ncbi:hypothetical protein [Candidatus Odyssella thessalonicensis]|uniref:hypothetical protein n=1 Tax=Candidatus Odyssella thessalonicensis TaxID=84647 RepID=UPI000225AF89|nr:hypothetical protein [Candidatus Odyssella thessalonicensis]
MEYLYELLTPWKLIINYLIEHHEAIMSGIINILQMILALTFFVGGFVWMITARRIMTKICVQFLYIFISIIIIGNTLPNEQGGNLLLLAIGIFSLTSFFTITSRMDPLLYPAMLEAAYKDDMIR